MLEFRILGPLEVVDGERPLGLGGPRQRGLLAILVLRRGQAVSSDRLIDELWGERPPATAAKTLQGYVSHLRKALGNDVLVTRGGGYLLEATPEQVDAGRFEAMVTEARRELAGGDTARARELLSSALGLWRGRHSPIWHMSLSHSARWRAWRKSAWGPSKTVSTPTCCSAITVTWSANSRASLTSTLTVSGCSGS